MAEQDLHPGLRRILAASQGAAIFDVLTQRLSHADLTTLLLGAFDQRATSVRPAHLVRRYMADRFVAPAQIDGRVLARVELAALDEAAPHFDPIALAPVVPFGTHRALGATPQNNVLTTARQTEVAADPTNALALEATARRAELLAVDARSNEAVHLAATQRVTRAQTFDGPRSFAHFALLGLVSAGRDRGRFAFEIEALRRQIAALIRTVQSTGPRQIEVRLSAFTPAAEPACSQLAERLSSPVTQCRLDPDREHGRGYYRNICFKLHAEFDDELVELGDGGDVWWTKELLQNNKERLVIGGLGLERLAMLMSEGARS